MGWKRFITEIISSIAWPCVALGFLLAFRVELSKVIQRLAHVKFKDLELEFNKVRQHAEELHTSMRGKAPAARSPILTSLEDQVLDAVEQAPSAAILLAWSGLETAIAATAARLAISPEPPSYRSPVHNIDMLLKHGDLSQSHSRLLHDMRMLRNKVAHDPESMLSITQDQAMDYARAAIDTANYLESLKRA